MSRFRLPATVLLLSYLSAPAAAAEAMFLDGGYAQLCALAATQMSEAKVPQRYQITGSRLGFAPLDVCTRAVNGYDGTNENVAESYNNRGVVHFLLENYDAALRDFDRAIREQPSLTQAYLNRGYTLNAQQRWSEAIPALDAGIARGSPELAKAYFNRAIAHEESGALSAARDDYQKAAELQPDWDAPREELARFSVIRR